MSTQPLVGILEKHLKLHKSLYQLEVEKTEVLKKSNIEALNSLLKNEKTYIHSIQMVEAERKKIISKLLPEIIDPTLTECLPMLEQSDQEKIVSIQQQLKIELDQLKDVNSLNHELLEQSLQFITLSLDLLLPNDVSAYTKEHKQENLLPNISLFDSKA